MGSAVHACGDDITYIAVYEDGIVREFLCPKQCPICNHIVPALYQPHADYRWMCSDCWTTRKDNPGMFELIVLARMVEATNG